MTPETGLLLTTLCYAFGAIAALSIAIPQATLLVRMRHVRDGLLSFRWKNALVYGACTVEALRTVAVWIDFVWFGQCYLGPIIHRWPFDLTVSAVFATALAFAAVLHWKTSREERPVA